MKFVKLFLFTLFLLSTTTFGHEDLTVLDPQQWWSNDQGTIEEAVLSIRPHGLYMEYGLYLTFSARNTYFSESDVLEIAFQFDLPKGAIVNDLWLWIGEDIMRAQIMDQWTASSIYEEIVDRQKDPAILFKRGKQSYELRVYPMAGNEQRKVKITYLVPTEWNPNSVSVKLPMNLINASKNKLSKMDIMFFPNEEWKEPKISELDNINFSLQQDSSNQDYYTAKIEGDDLISSLNFNVKSPIKNGIYVNKYGSGNDGIYQLAYFPANKIDVITTKKVALLIDYDPGKSNITLNELFSSIKNLLLEQFTKVDSFNIIYSKLEIKQASDIWLQADSATVDSVLSLILSDSFSYYSNLPSLLNFGIEFIKENGHDGNIMLIANSDQVGDVEIANQLLTDLKSVMDPIIPIHIVDFINRNYNYYWIGGRNYTGNEYFYLNLSRMCHSNFQRLLTSNSISVMFNSLVQSLSGLITSFDLHTSLQDGFCFGRFNTNLDESIYMNSPILQIGKYVGSFPLEIEISGVYNSEIFSNLAVISEEDIYEADSQSETIWIGNYISSLETGYESNEDINNIISLSLDNNILSLYTAFLALEPEDTSEFCYDCDPEDDLIIAVDDNDNFEIADSLFIQAYPNPFNPTTTLNVNLPKNVEQSEISMKIYSVLGEEIMSFDPLEYATSRKFQLSWNGLNKYGQTVSTGIYFFVVSSKEIRQTIKLMLMK